MYLNNRLTSSADLFGPHPRGDASKPVDSPNHITAEEALAITKAAIAARGGEQLEESVSAPVLSPTAAQKLHTEQFEPTLRRLFELLAGALQETRRADSLHRQICAAVTAAGFPVEAPEGFAMLATAMANVVREFAQSGLIPADHPLMKKLGM